ncbi:MAG TPA: sugar phosphate isomerase/epimerase [Limnochordia bacterium]|nr:sugar phosphate isomerase/epimerase [Limnochordia bacterium]
MKLSQVAINSVSTRGEFEETLGAYAAAGFKNVEFALGQVKAYLGAGHTRRDVVRLLEGHGLRCIGGFETGVRCFGSEAEIEANHALLAANAELIAELGGAVMVVGTDGPQPNSGVADPMGVIAGAMAQLADRIAATGVTLCIEFNWSPIVKSLRTAVEIARRSGRERVGVLFDPAHYHCTPSKFEQINAASVPYIRHVHIDDMRDKPGEMSDCNADRVLPGEGCLDLGRLIAALERYGYDGYFSIELFNQELWQLPPRAAADQMWRSMAALCS